MSEKTLSEAIRERNKAIQESAVRLENVKSQTIEILRGKISAEGGQVKMQRLNPKERQSWPIIRRTLQIEFDLNEDDLQSLIVPLAIEAVENGIYEVSIGDPTEGPVTKIGSFEDAANISQAVYNYLRDDQLEDVRFYSLNKAQNN